MSINLILDTHGLIVHTFAYNTLPNTIKQRFNKTQQTDYNNRFLNLMANVGGKLWTQMNACEWVDVQTTADSSNTHKNKNWFDERSSNIVHELLESSGLQDNATIIYPGALPAPLILLGELAGWSSPSPLGLGVNHSYGPWFAYRALFVTDEPLGPVSNQEAMAIAAQTPSPCVNCAAPCVSACPAKAVKKDDSFDIHRCAAHRISDTTTCATLCHARNACPIGSDYRYSNDQHSYHMTRALDALKQWANRG